MKRVAWTFLCGVFCAFGAQAALQNEWTFESDANGLPLTSATNAVGAAKFAGSSTNVFTASATSFQSSAGNRVLLCVGSATNKAGSAWTNGAVLNAALPTNSTGTYYLRYDVAYNFSPSNNSGTVLGAYFTGIGGAVNDRAAGFVLGYDKDSTGLAANAPARRPITRITGLATNGSLIAIAEINLSSNTLKVWYSVTGAAPTDYNSPAATKNGILLTSISNLCFHATGTFRSPETTNYAAVDNIRMADSWADITVAIPDFSKGPKIEIDRVTITTSKGTFTNANRSIGTVIGETNKVKVVIRSLGAPASNVTSSVTASANPGYFSITSNNTPVAGLLYPRYVTNTFSVIIKTNAANDSAYVFNVGATAVGASRATTNFSLTAGAQISYIGNSITVVSSNGVVSGKYEPGEILDITVISGNTGTRTVSNIVNSLSANPAYFTITNLTAQNYPVLDEGAATTTTYRVTILDAATNGAYRFSVTNRAASNVWPDSFSLDVFKQGIPSVSPASITMNVVAGLGATNSEVVVTNGGNAPLTFNITDDGAWDVSYDVTLGTLGNSAFVQKYNNVIVLHDPNTNNATISSTNDGVSSAISLGFKFPFYGTTYSNFYVTADGIVGLINATNVPALSTDRRALPATNVAAQLIAPFWGALGAPAGSIRYDRNSERLAISYNGIIRDGVSNLSFQVALFTNGDIEFRYKTISGVTNAFGQTNVTIGVQGSVVSYTNLAIRPVAGTSVRLTPQSDRWVSYPDWYVGLDRQSSAGITFTADASGRTAVTSMTFNAWFNWSTGGSNGVVVNVYVTNSAPVYSAVSSLSFTGPAGQVTSAPFIITNTGTSPLNFTIRDIGDTTSGYSSSNSAPYNWIDISATGTDITGGLIDPDPANQYLTAADEGFSAMTPLKFIFPFFGGGYTQFCVSVNGALRLDTTGRVSAVPLGFPSTPAMTLLVPPELIVPYGGDLVMDANATIKYLSTAEQLVVTWENVQQYGAGGGSNQTFQAILKPSGDITFQYKKVEGALSWPNTAIGMRDLPSSKVYTNGLEQPGDFSFITNEYGAVSKQYTNAVSNRAIQFRPTQIRVISYTPDSGSIAAGSNAVITITGDASNQSAGTNKIVNSRTLTIVHNVDEISTNKASKTLAVTFTATNSAEAAFVRAVADDSDGDGIPDDAERVAGTDPQNAGSVFTPMIERAPSGISLSWAAPLDGAQRTYIVYFTTNLMSGSGWNYLAKVTSGTTYLDTVHGDAPVIYYKVTVE